jgi:predicted transposase YdaD
MIDTLAAQEEWELLATAYLLGSLVFTKPDEKAWFQRRFEMRHDILEDTWAYQAIGERFREKGVKEGRQEGVQQTILNFMQARFPDLVALTKSQVRQIHDQAILDALILKVGTAQSGEEVLRFLAEVTENMVKQ